MKTVMTITCTLLLCATSFAQSTLSYAAYLRKSQVMWEQDVDQAAMDLKNNTTYREQVNLALAHFGYMNNALIDRNEEAFDAKMDEVKKVLKKLAKSYPEEGLPDALLSSLYGKEIAFNNMKGMFLGYKSGALAEKAYEKSPDNPIVLKLYGDYKWYTPAMFGGDKVEALGLYLKSKKAFESNANLTQNWLYLDLLASLGKAQKVNGQLDEARSTYELALQVEPDFYYVSKVLMPLLASND